MRFTKMHGAGNDYVFVDCFHEIIVKNPSEMARRISDRHLVHLLKRWLEAPVEETDERGQRRRTTRHKDEGRGTPQGAPLAPLLSNLYRRRFILGWKQLGHEGRLDAPIVNDADDFVICCRGSAEEALWEDVSIT